jgi:DNA-binding transcriptional ArsR family regulator
VLQEASARYPVTVEELRRALRMRPSAFDLALRGLVRKGLVVLEPLEDCTYVRPMASVGPGPPPLPIDEHDPAFM